MKLIQLKNNFRLRPFDVSTQEGREKERHRKILLTAVSSGAAKIFAAAISFAMIPLSLNYLGTERFGLWMTISAMVGMLGIADLGVGSGLMNAVSTAYGRDDIQSIRKRIGSGFLLLSTIALVIIAGFFIITPFVSWAQLLNVSGELATEEAAPTIAVVVIFFALSIPAGVVFKVLMGLQMGFLANIWLMVGNIIGFAAVLTVIYFGATLPYLAAATVSAPVIVAVLAGIYFWGVRNPLYRPQMVGLKVKDMNSLAGISGLFFILQLSGLIAFQSDYLIISHYLGPESVALYAVAFKLFTLPSIISSFFLNALWPAYAEAKSRGDMRWVFKSFFTSLRYSAIVVLPFSLVLLVGGRWIIENWVGSSITPGFDLLIGLFFWSILTILGGNFAALLNGLGIIKFQIIASLLMAIMNIALSIFLVQKIGISGVVWGSVLSISLFLYIPTIIYLRVLFKKEVAK